VTIQSPAAEASREGRKGRKGRKGIEAPDLKVYSPRDEGKTFGAKTIFLRFFATFAPLA
jgi:hypothetical protein